jgi:hypothetical protein
VACGLLFTGGCMTEHAPHEQIATDTDDVVTTSEGTGEPHYGCAYGDGSNLPAGFDGIKHQCSVEYDSAVEFDFMDLAGGSHKVPRSRFPSSYRRLREFLERWSPAD